MTIEIYNNGTWFNLTPWIAYKGLTFSRNDVDSPDAGRDMGGRMHRGRVADKEKMNINTIGLNGQQVAVLQMLIYPQEFMVRISPYPKTFSTEIFTMYTNNVKTTHVRHLRNGDDLWSVTFPLIEV